MPSRNILFRRRRIYCHSPYSRPGDIPYGLNTIGLITIGGKNDRILFIISPTERMSHPDMRSVCIRDIRLEAPCYMTGCRLKVS